MNLFINICLRFTLILPLLLLYSCGDSGSQLSKGHRDAIKIQCEDSSDPKACGLEVRQNFLEEGNEYIILDDGELNDDQIRNFDSSFSKKKNNKENYLEHNEEKFWEYLTDNRLLKTLTSRV